MPSVTCILFAAGIDWLETLLPFLFVAFWILSQVFAVFRRIAGGGKPQPPVVMPPARDGGGERRPRRPPPLPAENDDVRQQREVLQRQVEEFLKRASTERADPAQRPARPPAPAARKAVAPPASPPSAGGEKAAASAPLAPGKGRHVGSLEDAPTEVARHVKDVFAHDVGHLAPQLQAGARPKASVPAAPPAAAPTVAATNVAELVRAARDPATIRQAILLREVLERPVDRW